jgi:serine phosphatase RsbU (regulator of sigma subunit)
VGPPVITAAPQSKTPESSPRPDGSEAEPNQSPRTRPRRWHTPTIAVLLAGLLLTAMLSFGAAVVHRNNERRLLHQRVREVAAVVTTATSAVQTPLSSGAVHAEATHGNTTDFRRLYGPIVAKDRPFVSVSLWRAGASKPKPMVVVGVRPELETMPRAAIRQYLAAAQAASTFQLENLLNGSERRLGYALAASPHARYVVYAEGALPKNRRANIDSNSAFADLDYSLYVGTQPDDAQLIATSTAGGRLAQPRSSATIPFGDGQLLIVMHARDELGGTLLARLPWLLALLGTLLTLGAALLVERLCSRRDEAEALAAENAKLYADQHSVALTLQHSLMSDVLPETAGLEIGARYLAGVEGIDIGGDWYDVIPLGDDNVFVTVGDVSGRGLAAATTMAKIRFAIRAYAAEGDSPGVVLTKLSKLLEIGNDDHFATVLCARIDVPGHRVTFAKAGHLDPLLMVDTTSEFVRVPTGLPVGVARSPSYEETTLEVPRHATLLFYTDGLVERRGEIVDVGLERLRIASVSGIGRSVSSVLDDVVGVVIPNGSNDDTAILGVRWTT